MAAQNRDLRTVTEQVLALGRELRNGTIDRIKAMSDLELGLQAVLGGRPATAADVRPRPSCAPP